MIKREELNGKTIEDVQVMLNNDIDELAVNIETEDIEETKKREEPIINAMQEYDQHIRTVKYDLANKTDFEGENFNRKTIVDKIIYFFNRHEIEWNYTLGMYELVKMWKNILCNNDEQITYGAYDSTIRILGSLKYKGATEWRDIMIINEFLKSAHDAYLMDTIYLRYLAGLHNAVLNKIDPQPQQGPTPQMQMQ